MTDSTVPPEAVTTFTDARIAAWAYLTPHWPEEDLGVLTIAPWGWEAPHTWAITVVNDVADGEYVLIDRRSGEVHQPPWDVWLATIDRMTKVGDWSQAPK